MNRFELTNLWKTTLAERKEDIHERSRSELREAYFQLRSRVSTLVGEIPQDLRDFTVHDQTHLDALWETADIIAGTDWKMTPAEGFVLGCAILLHDAGMALSAHPDGLSEVQKDPRWSDTLAILWRKKVDRPANKAELLPTGAAWQDVEITKRATTEVLRFRHAERAEGLLFNKWTLASGKQFSLLDNEDLVDLYGTLIGQIALSHGFPIEEVEAKFKRRRAAPGKLPSDWEVDPLALACLIRCADAAHLDERRAPRFLQGLRQPSGVSADHWNFQARMLQPRLLSANLLEFASNSPFPLHEHRAWWLAFDALNVVDRELRESNLILCENGRPQFAARGVAHVNSPNQLSQTVQVEGWSPVDARLHVGDVVKLARTLGGTELYGNSSNVPIRELIQNAADATRARRSLEDWPNDWGTITVRIGFDAAFQNKRDSGWFLDVEDTGVGMSEVVLTGPLLDFGTSFWGSWEMLDEHPGLAGKGFAATGKYGIGFFSAFMWADRIQVTTRRYNEGQSDTRVLEFEAGLNARPLLRPARKDEYLRESITKVRLWLHKAPRDEGGFLYDYRANAATSQFLDEFCAWLCPTLDVNLKTQEENELIKSAILANDWVNMNGGAFLTRLWNLNHRERNPQEDQIANLRDQAQILGDELHLFRASDEQANAGEPIGRVTMDVHQYATMDFTRAQITVGGFRSGVDRQMVGALIGQTTRASRENALPFADREWPSVMKEIAPSISSRVKNPEDLILFSAASRIRGGETFAWPVARHKSGYLNLDEVRNLAQNSSELLIGNHVALEVELSVLDQRHRNVINWSEYLKDLDWELKENLIFAEENLNYERFPLPPSGSTALGSGWHFISLSLVGLILTCVAEEWKCSIQQLASTSHVRLFNGGVKTPVATNKVGLEANIHVNALRNPAHHAVVFDEALDPKNWNRT